MKNFLTVGNSGITIDLKKSNRTLISGRNGVGKSTLICESIVYALFGKSFRGLTKAELVNNISGRSCEVSIAFKKYDDTYHIIRKIKPDALELRKNGSLVDFPSNTKIEDEIVSIIESDYKSFIRRFILSTTNYKPFFQMKADERRDFVEKMLDLEFISTMAKRQKEIHSGIEDRIFDVKNETIVLKTRLEEKNKFKKMQDADDFSKLEELKENIKKEVSVYKKLSDVVSSFGEMDYNLSNIFTNKIQKLVSKKAEIESEIRSIEEGTKKIKLRLDFFDKHATCKMCTQHISDQVKESQKSEMLKEICDADEKINSLKDSLKHLVVEIESQKKLKDESSEVFAKYQQALYGMNSQKKYLDGLTSDYQKLKTKSEKKVDTLIDGEIQEIEKFLSGKSYELSELMVEYNDSKEILNALKDSGLKSKLLESFMPFLNQRISHYLDLLEFPFSVILNEKFEENIFQRYHNEFSYDSLSSGQKQRVELALLFAWRDVSNKTLETNLLVFDEILDSSLDADGIDGLFNILDQLKNTNIFIISHKGNALGDRIENEIKLKRVDGFTVLEKE